MFAWLIRMSTALASRWRNVYFRLLGVRLNGYVRLERVEIPRNYASIRIAPGAALDRGVTLLCTGDQDRELLRIGARCYINRHSILDASECLEIGQDVMIGPFCYITDHDHQFDGSTRPAAGPLQSAATRIADRVWLGAHVTVLKGVEIGEGCVVGAGSVVTRSLPARSVAVGNPARVVRSLERPASPPTSVGLRSLSASSNVMS